MAQFRGRNAYFYHTKAGEPRWRVDRGYPKSRCENTNDEQEARRWVAEVNTKIMMARAVAGDVPNQTSIGLINAWDIFVNEVVSKLRPNTQHTYKTSFSLIKAVSKVEHLNNNALYTLLASKGYSTATIWKYWSCYQRFLQWCDTRNFKTANDWKDFNWEQVQGTPRKELGFLQHDTFDRIIRTIEKKWPSFGNMCRIQGYLGLRVDELISLKRCDLDTVNGVATIRGKGDAVKGRKIRQLECGVDLIKTILQTSDDLYSKHQITPTSQSTVFIEERFGRKLQYTTVVKRWRTCVSLAGLDPKLLTTHSLRRYAYLWLHDQGMDYEVIKQVLGHDSDAYQRYIGNLTGKLKAVNFPVVSPNLHPRSPAKTTVHSRATGDTPEPSSVINASLGDTKPQTG